MDRIGVFFGGKSTEHEVSCISATAVIKAIDKEKHSLVYIGINKEGKWFRYDGPVDSIADGSWEETAEPMSMGELPELIDFALPIMHGAYGEDGKLQGVFEMLDIPYAGCGVLGSALAMDKEAAKLCFLAEGVPTCEFVNTTAKEVTEDPEPIIKICEEEFHYPMFVKPVNLGSSVGISKVRNTEELRDGLKVAARYDKRIIIERGIDGREVECGVIGNEEPLVTGIGEIVAGNDFYDYEAKYSGNVGTVVTVPAENVPDETVQKIRAIAAKAYKVLDCEGFARVDFMIENGTGNIYLNEINTIPGFTQYSMFPTLWQVAGVPFTELIERIVGYGYERYNAKNNRETVRR